MTDTENNYLNMILVDRIIDNNYLHKNTKQKYSRELMVELIRNVYVCESFLSLLFVL